MFKSKGEKMNSEQVKDIVKVALDLTKGDILEILEKYRERREANDGSNI